MRILIAILLTLLHVGTVEARVRGASATGSTGSANLNLGGNDKIPANFINVFKTASVASSNAGADLLKLDDDGYLTSGTTGNLTINFPAANTMFTNTQYRLRVGAGIQFSALRISTNATSCSVTGAVSFSGCTGVGNTDVSTSSAAGGTLTFTTSTTQFTIFYVAGSTASRSGGELALYRVSDEADYNAGEIFTPEFRASSGVIAALNPRVIRPMGWVHAGSANFNGETTWNYRHKLTTFSWGARYPTGARCGTPFAISGTDTYAGPAAPDTPGSYTDGEQYQCVITNANTSSTISLNVAGRGPKTVLLQDGLQTPIVGAITAGAIATFTYDSILDVWLLACDNVFSRTACSIGLNASVPIEAQVQLANRLRSNLWAVIPPWANDNYVTQLSTVIRNELDPVLYAYFEYGNELWNTGFSQATWAGQRGLALGWSAASNSARYGWYGLRVKQTMGSLIPAVFSGQTSRLRRVMSYQAAGDTTNVTNRFNGQQLRSCTSFGVPCGNSVYDTLTGTANYTAFPNRPIDQTEVLSYAPYAGGENLCTGGDLNCAPTAVNAPFYQALVTAQEAGDTATVASLIDDDIRTGRTSVQNVTGSGTTFTTPVAHGFTAGTTDISFQVSGGTIYSGVVASTLYRVTSTPLSTTFTMQPYVGGFPSGANVNAGSAGSGTMTVGTNIRKNLVNLSSSWYQFGEANAALYDAVRTGAGMPLLRVEQYEGNVEPKGLNATQCTNLVITTVPPDGTGALCASEIAAAIVVWKNDLKARATQKAYFDQFMGYDSAAPPTSGLMTHSKTPAQLVLAQGGTACAGSEYAMLSGCLPTSTPFQTYHGFRTFSAAP